MRTLYRFLLEACGFAAGFTIALLALAVSVDVLIRNLGWGNMPWLIEVSEYALYAVAFLGAPWVLRHHAHVRVDNFLQLLPRAAARRLETLADTIGLAVSAILIYYGWLATADAYRLGSLIFKVLTIPEWWLLWIMPFSGALLAVEFAQRIGRALRADGATPPAAPADAL